MSWWDRDKKKRPPWWEDDWFADFDKIQDMIKEMMRGFGPMDPDMLKKGARGPYVWGFSASTGPDGRINIRPFGNVKPGTRGRPLLKETREPLVDVIEEKEEIVIVAELPGVTKDDIKLSAAKMTVTINVETEERKYYKEVALPSEIIPKTANARFKNGVLEARFKKIKPSPEPSGTEVKIQ